MNETNKLQRSQTQGSWDTQAKWNYDDDIYLKWKAWEKCSLPWFVWNMNWNAVECCCSTPYVGNYVTLPLCSTSLLSPRLRCFLARGCAALRWLHAITYRIFDPSIRIVAQSACHSNCSRARILLEHELSINKLQTDEMIWCTRVIDCIQQDCVGDERTESHGDRKPETKVKIPLKCSVWKMDPLIHILKLLPVAAVSSSRVHVARRRW